MNKTIDKKKINNQEISQQFIKFGLPQGVIWLANAKLGDTLVTSHGSTRDEAKENSLNALIRRMHSKDGMVTGVGNTPKDAEFDAISQYSLNQALQSYASQGKSPMLVVGVSNYLRTLVPFYLIQEYDLHLMFYPNSSPFWIVGLVAMSRKEAAGVPIKMVACDQNINKAIQKVIGSLLVEIQPEQPVEVYEKHGEKINAWEVNAIYRCPKISLKDVLHLEEYKPDSAVNYMVIDLGMRTDNNIKQVDERFICQLEQYTKTEPSFGLRVIKGGKQ